MHAFFNQTSLFCEDDAEINPHRTYLPTLQNDLCKFLSSWEIVSRSPDFAGASPLEFAPATDFEILRPAQGDFVMVLDTSGSMAQGTNRLLRLKQAAKRWIQLDVEVSGAKRNCNEKKRNKFSSFLFLFLLPRYRTAPGWGSPTSPTSRPSRATPAWTGR